MYNVHICTMYIYVQCTYIITCIGSRHFNKNNGCDVYVYT